MTKVYFVSGLGADHRVFKYLEISFPYKHISWIKPEKGESIQSYSKKLISQIDPNDDVILIGVSFGGLICQEISKIVVCKQIIIISSIKCIKELSGLFQFVKISRIYKLLPSFIIRPISLLTANYFFNINSKEEAILLKEIIKDTDPKFAKWAINTILSWKTSSVSSEIIHIHGTVDRIFPSRFLSDFIPVKDGGHFMIINKAKEISKIINQKLLK
jgi:hypothetical protein